MTTCIDSIQFGLTSWLEFIGGVLVCWQVVQYLTNEAGCGKLNQIVFGLYNLFGLNLYLGGEYLGRGT